jgi:hypothetical protein
MRYEMQGDELAILFDQDEIRDALDWEAVIEEEVRLDTEEGIPLNEILTLPSRRNPLSEAILERGRKKRRHIFEHEGRQAYERYCEEQEAMSDGVPALIVHAMTRIEADLLLQ